MGMDLTGVAAEAAQPSAKQAAAPTTRVEMQEQLNRSIVQNAVTVSTNAQNEPLALLFKSVVDKLNKVLEPEMGEDAIENAVSQDNTPAGTASRIIAQSTAFYSAFQKNHAEEEPADVLSKFMELIRGGIDQGFKGARGILKDLDVLKDDIASNIDKTYELVQQGLADFEAAQSQSEPLE